MTHNVTHNTNLWDGDHYVTSLSGCDMHLEADAKVLATSLKRLACFIQKHPLKSCPIEQFFFFLNHQFVTQCSIAVHGRLSTTSSLQFWGLRGQKPPSQANIHN